jgi:hypothetical protein
MAWTMWCCYDLNYVFAYACFYDTSMGHYKWYLVPCNELSLTPNALLPLYHFKRCEAKGRYATGTAACEPRSDQCA